METNLETVKNLGSSRMAGDERRLQILGIAVQLFSQRGLRGTTTREIAAAAGVSEAMVFRHFATKNELYTAILDQKACEGGINNQIKVVGKDIDAKDDYAVFYNLAINMLNHHRDEPEFMRLLMHSALEGHELADLFFERYIVDFYKFLGGYIKERQADGVFRQIEPSIVVRAFVGMIIHHSLNNTLWDRDQKILKISDEDAARQFTEMLLGGVMLKDQESRIRDEK